MSFEYNGVVYRDLEPQVRYDAEQVQLLKQADVTINESLQTINTEINGKLTKPANPSAESAITILTNKTIKTKLLSEIGGGGGGKIYKKTIGLTSQRISYIIILISSDNTTYDFNSLLENTNKFVSGYLELEDFSRYSITDIIKDDVMLTIFNMSPTMSYTLDSENTVVNFCNVTEL